jgi:Flp pilus assembly protein protease CpaA
MAEHAAHAPAAHDSQDPAPWLANAGFALGIIGVILCATIKLSPIGFLAGGGALLLGVLGLGQAIAQARYNRTAIAAMFCGLLVVVFWLIVRHDITSVAGGRDAWPSWIL